MQWAGGGGGLEGFFFYTQSRGKQVSVVAIVLGPNFSSVLTILGHFFAVVFVATPVFAIFMIQEFTSILAFAIHVNVQAFRI